MAAPALIEGPRYDRARALSAACGATGPLRVVVRREDEPAAAALENVLDAPVAVLGRDAAADIVLDDPQVSRRHAVLLVVAGRVLVLDLESRTGIDWAKSGSSESWLEPGDGIRIGPYRIEARVEDDPAAGSWPEPAIWPPGCRFPLSSRPLAHDQLPGLLLEFPAASGVEASEWEMRSLVSLVGSASGCKVRIESAGLSRYECALLRTPRGPWAVGLGGRGGLRERGVPCRFLPLLDAEAFEVGPWSIRPRVRPPARRPSDRAAVGLARRSSPRTPARARTEPELIEQFGSMQAEMLEQVRQSLLTMGRWLGEVHREEMERIRAELAELRAAIAARDAAPGGAVREEPAADAHRPRSLEFEGTPPCPDPAPVPDAAAGEDLHRLLIGRLERLQREQKRRWKRMVQRPPGRDD